MGLWICTLKHEEQDAKPGKAKLDACPLNKTKDRLRVLFVFSSPFHPLPNQGKNNTKTKQKHLWGEEEPGDYLCVIYISISSHMPISMVIRSQNKSTETLPAIKTQ